MTLLQLGVFEVSYDGKVVLIGPRFTDSERDRKTMRRIIDRVNQRVASDPKLSFAVGVFPAHSSSPISELERVT